MEASDAYAMEAGYDCSERLTSWAEAFNGLKEVIKKSKEKKKVIFIDELSWMDTKDSGLVTELEHFWNGWATARKEKDITELYDWLFENNRVSDVQKANKDAEYRKKLFDEYSTALKKKDWPHIKRLFWR